MSKIEILNSRTGAVLFALDEAGATIRGAVEAAVKSGADLRDSDLRGANLRVSDLRDSDLRGSDLRGAYLLGSDLSGETLSRTPVSIGNLKYPVLITGNFMTIGCQRHTHSEWEDFDLDKIEAMDNGAGEMWEQYRDPLLALCKLHKEGV